jgi:tetratricopeptide (TPR) repeat protein
MKAERWGGPALLIGGVLLGYANSFSGSFQFDDFNVIVDNPSVHSIPAWLAGARRGIRPLLKLTYALNWTSGMGAFGFHLFNVALHASNVLLVYFLSRRLFSRGGGTSGEDAAPPAPLLAALLFAVHPVQTEAVTYISGRSMSLMAFFYLGSLLSYVRGVETNGRVRLYLASPALFLLALMSKEAAVTLPAALLLWEIASPGGRPAWREIARRQAAHWTLLACAVSVILLHPVYRHILESGLASVAPGRTAATQAHGVAYLLSRLAMVHRLNIDPDLRIPPGWTPSLAAEAFTLLSLVALGVAACRKAPSLGFGILWFFLQLSPTNSLIPRLDVANERHLYLAAWGIFLAVGAGVEKLRAAGFSGGKRIPAAAILVLILLAGSTIARNRAYRSEVALWESTVRLSPGKPRAHNNLGYAYQLAGMPDKAAGAYREALRLDGEFRIARRNLAILSGKP